MRKFKVGDKVKRVKRFDNHEWLECVRKAPSGPYIVTAVKGDSWLQINHLAWGREDTPLAVENFELASEAPAQPDQVNNPSHYASGAVECIDAIEASMTAEAFKGYLKGNVMKYMWRYEKKINPVQDLEKAQWYQKKLIEVEKKQ